LSHTGTPDVGFFTRTAGILIVAAGQPGGLGGDHVKPRATLIHVGITRVANAKLVGDVDVESTPNVAGAITPVPGAWVR